MADTYTANFHWTKPDPGGDSNQWGNILNGTIDKIDNQVGLNQQAGIPVGALLMWGGLTPPTNWVLCDGMSYSASGTYAALYAVLLTAYNNPGDPPGTFRVPNLTNAFPYGGVASGVTGGAATVTLDNTMIPSHAHTITDVNHTHTVNQYYHDHSYSQTAHGHTVNDPQHQHSFTGSMGGAGPGGGSALINSGSSLTAFASTGIGIQAANANINFVGNTSNVSLNASGTNLTTTNSDGGGQPHNNMPPYLGVKFIIKFA